MKLSCLRSIFFIGSFLTSVCFAKSMVIDDAGVLSGMVIDETTLAPLVAVNVIVENSLLGAASDVDGHYLIEGLKPGMYNVRFSMMGYEDRYINNVAINPNRTTFQQIELTPKVLQGQELVVSAGYFHEAKDGIVSNRSMDFEEIRSDPGSAEDIQRVVQVLPSVVSGTDQDNEIIVRGGMPGENLFVMDDIEIANPNHFSEQGLGGGPINMLNTKFVRRIDFYAGAFPARYGDKASSVMDISLREGSRTRNTGHAELGMAGTGLMVEGPLNQGKGSFLLSGRKSYLDLIKNAVGLTAVPVYFNIQGKVVYDLGPGDQMIMNMVIGKDRIKITPETEEEYDDDKNYIHSKSHQTILGGTWRHLLGQKGYSKFTVSQVINHWDLTVEDTLHTLDYENYSTEIERTAKLEWVYLPVKRVELNAGVQLKGVDYDIHQWIQGDTLFNYNLTSGTPVKESIFQVYDSQDRSHAKCTYKCALFGHVKWEVHPRVQLTLGAHYDYFDLTRHHALDPRGGLSFQLLPGTKLNLAYGFYSQAPDYVNMAAHPNNSHLDYKKTQQVVLGMDHLFREDMRGTLEVFYKDYQDIPIETSDLTADPYDESYGEMVNAGHGFSKGIEFFLQKKLTQNYHFTVSYAYSIAKGYDERHDRYYNWDYDYRHVFSVMSGARFRLREKDWYRTWSEKTSFKILSWLLPLGDEVDISLRWRYLGGRPYTAPSYYPDHQTWIASEAVYTNTHRYPAYHRLDLRIDSRYRFKHFNVVTYFDMMNVYGRKNVWDYVYQDDGTIDVVHQFSMVPISGITIEF